MFATPPPLERSAKTVDVTLQVETPENVILTYMLAGPTLRATAYFIDLALRIMVVIALFVVALCAGVVAPGASVGMFLLVLFGVTWGYYALFEAFWNGRTPGKWAMSLRVIQEQGYPITFWSAVGRNLVRTADALGLYAVGFVSMLLSPRFQRLGDLLARTVVICERNIVLPREPIILERIDSLPRDEVPGPPPAPGTLTLIDRFLGRRHAVSMERGHAMARPLAVSLARRLRYSGDSELVLRYPMAFLARVYVTFLRRDEEEERELRSLPRRHRDQDQSPGRGR